MHVAKNILTVLLVLQTLAAVGCADSKPGSSAAITPLAPSPADTGPVAVSGSVALVERLVAFVVLAPGASATPEMLKQHVRENLANYKVPRDVVLLDELPRNAIGKIMRGELKARLVGTGQQS